MLAWDVRLPTAATKYLDSCILCCSSHTSSEVLGVVLEHDAELLYERRAALSARATAAPESRPADTSVTLRLERGPQPLIEYKAC